MEAHWQSYKEQKKNNQWNEAHSKFAVNTLKGEFHKIV